MIPRVRSYRRYRGIVISASRYKIRSQPHKSQYKALPLEQSRLSSPKSKQRLLLVIHALFPGLWSRGPRGTEEDVIGSGDV
eukprot:3877485-Rhodomonas_salina.6